MERRIVGIKEVSANTFRLSFNGYVLGSGPGYSKSEAIEKAREFVRKRPIDGKWIGYIWVEFENILAMEIS